MKKIIEEFDERFYSPKTLWAKDKNEKWYHKKDVRNFIIDTFAQRDKEIVEMIKKEREKWRAGNSWYDNVEKALDDIIKKITNK